MRLNHGRHSASAKPQAFIRRITMAISANDVKTLRDRTNAPMMECKAALNEAGGDMDKAIDILRKKIKGLTAKFGAREMAEGRVATFVCTKDKVGAIVE